MRPGRVVRPCRLACRAALLALVAGCSEGTTPPPAGLTLCAVPLTVTIAAGDTPTFRWSPPCGATYLEVTTPNRQQVVWIVQGDTGKVAPGVRYGVAPPAYTSRLGPLPLVRGSAYLVRVGIMIDEDSFATFGEGAFVY